MRTATVTLVMCLAACGGRSGLDRGGDPIDEWPTGGVLYVEDHLGTVVATVDADGVVASRAAYHPYGAKRGSQGGSEPHGYVGNERDVGSRLSHFDARAYRDETAAFQSVDPLALEPGGDPEKARLGAYAYAHGNPVAFVDRDGRNPKKAQKAKKKREQFERAVDAQISRVRSFRSAYNDRDSMIARISDYNGMDVGGYIFAGYKKWGSGRTKVAGHRLGYVNINAPEGTLARPGWGGCYNCTQKGSKALVIAVRPRFDVDTIRLNEDYYNRLSAKIEAPVFVVSNGKEVFKFHEGEMTQTHPKPEPESKDDD